MSNQPIPTSRNRSANASIAGYAYQFDLTTLEILAAGEHDTIVVEGCEDIDIDRGIRQESVQCKYLEAAKYSLAGLRKPLVPMLRAFVDGKRCEYRLYVHYGNADGVPARLTIEELKESLTERKRSEPRTIKHHAGIGVADLEAFLKHFTIQSGGKFREQQKQVSDALGQALQAPAEDVRDLHYAKAVAVVLDLAIQPEQRDRTITRGEFLARLDKRPEIYARWHAEIIGAERFRALLKRRVKAVGLLASEKRRLIVLGRGSGLGAGELVQVSHLVEKLATTGYGEGKLSSAKPWTVIYDAPAEDVLELKRRLIELGVAYHDGFEMVRFSPKMFDRAPTINTHPSSKKIKSTSYDVRVIAAATYKAHLAQIDPPTVLISFATARAADFLGAGATQTLDVPGWRPEDILDLLGVAK